MQPRFLSDLCLLSIRDSVESGKIMDLSEVVPAYRLKLFKLALMRGLINNPIFQASFSSVEFLRILNGVIDLQDGSIDDHLFLDRIALSLDAPMGDHTLGSTITELRLNLYSLEPVERMPSNFNSLISVISKCPNLKSLHLHVLANEITYDGEHAREPDLDDLYFLNEWEPTLPIISVMENLEELSLTSDERVFSVRDGPVITFNQLKSLNLIGLDDLKSESWTQLMQFVRDTLTVLHIDVMSENNADGEYLPFPMPKLQSFSINGVNMFPNIDHLTNCPCLTDVKINYYWYADAAVVARLNRLDANVGLELWDPKDDILKAMTGGNCIITKLLIIITKHDEQSLHSFLHNYQYASRLQELHLSGSADTQLLNDVFMKCSNLEKLTIRNCPLLIDQHLINLAAHGIKLCKLVIIMSQQITDEGLIPLIINSGEKLMEFEFFRGDTSPWTDKRLWNILAHCSPCIKSVKYVQLDEEFEKKFFRKNAFTEE